MKPSDDVVGISVACRTPELIKVAVESFRKFYPENKLIIVNGLCGDETTKYLMKLPKNDNNVKCLFFIDNIGHGPGMDIALRYADSMGAEYAYVFDSDTEILKPPIDDMIAKTNVVWYAVGSVGLIDDRGFAGRDDSYIPYVHPSIMLLNIHQYLKFAPFVDHGAPLVDAMKSLKSSDNPPALLKFPVRDYVYHGWRGTRNVTRKYL